MNKAFYAITFGAALLVGGSTGVFAQVITAERDCAVDLKSLCAGVKPGEGRVLACLQSHMSGLSVGCSSRLSKAIWVARECAGDIKHFCPDATAGSVSHCMRPHLSEASDQCKGALAYIASPAADR